MRILGTISACLFVSLLHRLLSLSFPAFLSLSLSVFSILVKNAPLSLATSEVLFASVCLSIVISLSDIYTCSKRRGILFGNSYNKITYSTAKISPCLFVTLQSSGFTLRLLMRQKGSRSTADLYSGSRSTADQYRKPQNCGSV